MQLNFFFNLVGHNRPASDRIQLRIERSVNTGPGPSSWFDRWLGLRFVQQVPVLSVYSARINSVGILRFQQRHQSSVWNVGLPVPGSDGQWTALQSWKLLQTGSGSRILVLWNGCQDQPMGLLLPAESRVRIYGRNALSLVNSKYLLCYPTDLIQTKSCSVDLGMFYNFSFRSNSIRASVRLQIPKMPMNANRWRAQQMSEFVHLRPNFCSDWVGLKRSFIESPKVYQTVFVSMKSTYKHAS